MLKTNVNFICKNFQHKLEFINLFTYGTVISEVKTNTWTQNHFTNYVKRDTFFIIEHLSLRCSADREAKMRENSSVP